MAHDGRHTRFTHLCKQAVFLRCTEVVANLEKRHACVAEHHDPERREKLLSPPGFPPPGRRMHAALTPHQRLALVPCITCLVWSQSMRWETREELCNKGRIFACESWADSWLCAPLVDQCTVQAPYVHRGAAIKAAAARADALLNTRDLAVVAQRCCFSATPFAPGRHAWRHRLHDVSAMRGGVLAWAGRTRPYQGKATTPQ